LFSNDEPNKVLQNPKWNGLFLEPLKGHELSKKSVMVRPCISVVVNIEGFALCKDSLCPFCDHHVVFEVVIQFLIFVLFLVQTI
jgi:K+ transporter